MNESSSIANQQVTVKVKTAFVESQSSRDQERYVFSYTITIANYGDEPVTLLSRSWLITDADGNKVSVEGDGVVGQTPTIDPDQQFEYSSGSILKTPLGTMEGFYTMETAAGDKIRVEIPVFRLAVPNILN